jgi:DNA-binding response OmpR family regulator
MTTIKSSYKVLLVDDAISLHAFIRYMLQHTSKGLFDLVTLTSTEDMLEQVGTINPDIILLDINLPYMDGIEGCRKLRETYPDIPVVIITAELDVQERMIDSLDAGAQGFVTKPFNAEKLNQILYYHLGISALEPVKPLSPHCHSHESKTGVSSPHSKLELKLHPPRWKLSSSL